MKKILHIISSPRADNSFSIKLGNAIVNKIKEAYPGSSTNNVNLVEHQFPHLEESHLTSFFTPSENRTAEHAELVRHSDQSIAEIKDADIIVIGAPVYNFNIHSTLKAWIDHIVRAGITFKYDENGPQGLLSNKKVYVAIASGGVFSEGPLKPIDYVEPYLKTILSFIGLTDITFFRVEGLMVPELKDIALEKAISSLHLN
jgi:FMN-dependent NADH-azoreductase